MRLITTIFPIIVLFSIFISCCPEIDDDTQSLKDQIGVLEKENERLKSKSGAREASVSEYQRTLEEIDYNLRTIELNLIQVSSAAGRDVPVKQRIENRLSVIQNLIQNSNLKIRSLDQNLDELRRSAKDKSKEILALERVMKNAASVLISKEEEFNQKKTELELGGDDLEKTYEEQLEITFELYKMVNRAYFVKGTQTDLVKFGILDEGGAFIGIDKVKILNASATESVFEQVEKDKQGSFVFDEERIKVITIHPESTYTLKKTPSRNVITVKDKKNFWKNGNYLIVQTN